MKKNIFFFAFMIVIVSLKAQNDTATNAPVLTIAQVMPRFHGDLSAFLISNINYPQSAIKNHTEGTVYVKFVVEKDGSISNISLSRGTTSDLDDEALRVVSAMPAWSPGYNAGKAVRVSYTLPIKFTLDNLKSPDRSDGDTTVTYEPDVKPKFNGDLNTYLKSHLQYPKSAIDRKIEGTVYVTFLVSKTGRIKSATILRGVDTALDKEALSVVNNMPDWTPGTVQNTPVNVQYTLPIRFELNTKTADITDEFNPDMPVSKPNSTSSEQPETTCKSSRKGIGIEPHLGLGFSWVFMDHSNTNTLVGFPTLGFSAGCDIGVIYNDNGGLVTGLQIQQYGSHYSSGNKYVYAQTAPTPVATSGSTADTSTISDHSASVNYTFTYLQVPLMFRYVTSDACSTGFHFQGGFLIGYLVHASESGSVTESINQWIKEGQGIAEFYTYSSNTTQSQSANATPDASKIDLELVCGVGLYTPLSPSMSLAIDFIPELKLSNAGDGLKDMVNFGNNPYSYYGPGNYGGGMAFLIDAKLIFHNSKK